MKRRDLVKVITDMGCWLLRHGGDHDVYTNGERITVIPRHNEIKEQLAKKIIKDMEIKK